VGLGGLFGLHLYHGPALGLGGKWEGVFPPLDAPDFPTKNPKRLPTPEKKRGRAPKEHGFKEHRTGDLGGGKRKTQNSETKKTNGGKTRGAPG